MWVHVIVPPYERKKDDGVTEEERKKTEWSGRELLAACAPEQHRCFSLFLYLPFFFDFISSSGNHSNINSSRSTPFCGIKLLNATLLQLLSLFSGYRGGVRKASVV